MSNNRDINEENIFDTDIMNQGDMLQGEGDMLQGIFNNTNRNISSRGMPYFTNIEVENAMYGNLLDHVYVEEEDKQFIIDILISEDNKRWNAFCMGKHHRLGKESPIQILPDDVFKIVRKFHRQDIENMIDDETIEDILMIMEQTECSVQTAVEVYLKTNRNMVEAIIMLYTWWF